MDASMSYEEYCHEFLQDVGEEQYQLNFSTPDFHLNFRRAFFVGGAQLFGEDRVDPSFRKSGKSASLRTSSVTPVSQHDGQKYIVESSLLLMNRSHLWSLDSFNRTRVFRKKGAIQQSLAWLQGKRLMLKGLWFPGSGTLCMAGCFVQNSLSKVPDMNNCKVKALFQFPELNTINHSLVKGILQSKRDVLDPLFFEPIHITAISEAPYVFRKVDNNAYEGVLARPNVPEHINVWKDVAAVHDFPWYRQTFTVVWDNQCMGQDCSPFRVSGPTVSTVLSVEQMVFSDGRFHGFFLFRHGQFQGSHGSPHLDTDIVAIEGMWNALTGQLSAFGCYLDGATNSSLAYDSSDCDIAITLQFPVTLDLTFRYSVVGRVERKNGSGLKAFKPFSFTGHMDISFGPIGWGSTSPQLEYVYTPKRVDEAQSHCQGSHSAHSDRSKITRRKLKYPAGHLFADLGFMATLKYSSGSMSKAFFSPVAVNKRTNSHFNPAVGLVTSAVVSSMKMNVNISYDINLFESFQGFKLVQNTTIFQHLPAEGVYSPRTGTVCLSACRCVALIPLLGQTQVDHGDWDCETHIRLQYPPTNPGYLDKLQVTGEFVSLRNQKDPLYFDRVIISSGPIFYEEQAASSLIQIDFEMIMGIVSLTLSILFIGFQLYHVRKNPKVLPQMSLLALFVLTLGYLIPLVLNFEAIFSNRSKQNVLEWSDGWLEINEVIVRLMTMVVFLLLVCLLHLSRVSKCEISGSEGPWQMEKAPFRVCLIPYMFAGLIAIVIYGIKQSNFLDGLKRFAGLAVDFFLFPQLVGNYVWEVQGTVLSFPFYMGMSFVRSLPHVYDILRRSEFFSIRDRRYYYANPNWDFYSTAWDTAIPCGCLLLALILFCQQRYGGSCFTQTPWRQRNTYKQISMSPI
ncbi:hypothetical protein KP509_33G021400 [Ceratopteris richardii]|nr:hypothetical protein KP509_33G021400 [Ceratopteris richardii]